ncbi:MAG TPA: zinc-binding dehydrogenase [Roseiarcus sp.]|nr:zinc-binding dehydrogenase [Roseiarcus sp.]
MSVKTGLQLRSLISDAGRLELSLATVETPSPAPDEVVIRVEAAPINPSDIGLLLGPADMATATLSYADGAPVVTATVPERSLKAVAGRLNQSLPVGNEGAGVVVETGATKEAMALLGRTVAMLGGAMYSQYRCLKAADCLALPEGVTPSEGASSFVNPMTALGMVETMRREGHSALVHTAAASNLGQMLNKLCLKDGVGLVNIVRSAEQEATLRSAGARHVCSSTSPSFMADLTRDIAATGATLAFDAIGGGKIVGQILTAMEVAANAKSKTYSRYGSTLHKQVYIYGGLDTGPTEFNRNFGMAWAVGGWLLFPFLQKIDPADVKRLKERVAAEIKTTFASRYAGVVSLEEALRPETIAAYSRRATGGKYLINPNLGRDR